VAAEMRLLVNLHPFVGSWDCSGLTYAPDEPQTFKEATDMGTSNGYCVLKENVRVVTMN